MLLDSAVLRVNRIRITRRLQEISVVNVQTASRNWCKVTGKEFIGILTHLRNVLLDLYTWNSMLFPKLRNDPRGV